MDELDRVLDKMRDWGLRFDCQTAKVESRVPTKPMIKVYSQSANSQKVDGHMSVDHDPRWIHAHTGSAPQLPPQGLLLDG